MDKRNALLVVVIAIATLIIVIGTAAFAYFSANIKNNSNLNVNVTTSSKQASFIATSSGDLNLSVESYMMQEHDATNDNLNTSSNEDMATLLTKNATLNVSLTGTDEGKTTTCSYDIVYTWSGEGGFTEELEDVESKENGKIYPSKYYIRSEVKSDSSEYTVGFKELTIEVDHNNIYVDEDGSEDRNFSSPSLIETNIDELTKVEGSENKLYLKKGETITSASATKASHVDYLVTIKFYNLGINQDKLMNKNFTGTVGIENVVC